MPKTIEESVGRSIRVSGKWWDTLRYSDGRVVDGPEGSILWPSNQIQDMMASLLACLVKGEAGYSRIGFMGIGHGLVGWDTIPPTLDPTDTTLEDEFFRKTIDLTDIYFIDPATNLPVGPGVITPKIEINITLLAAEANGTLREFGLFGGTATAALDSGEIVNWVSHSRIDKDVTLEIQRRVRILFQTA